MSAVKRQRELVNHGPCPCGESSDAYTEYEDGHGFCYSCNKPFGLTQLKPEQLERKVVDGYRGISSAACEALGIYSYVDKDDNVLFREYNDPNGRKFRRCPKEGFWVEGKVPPLGGTHLWNAGSYHYITVVEGEEDAAAFWDMMNKGKKTTQPVVWLTSASVPKKGRQFIYDYLSKFETVKLAFESDEAGSNAKSVLREMLPNKIREVSLTKHKDANDYLLAGDEQEFKRAWDNALIFTPDNIYHTQEDIEKVLDNEEVESYIETPFSELNDKIRGLPLNHVTLITGQEGMGKTEFLRALEYEVVRSGVPVGILHQEETKKTTLKKLASYELMQDCSDPDAPIDKKDLMDALTKITNKFQNLFVFEFKQDPDVNTILEQINYLVHVCGVRYVFIDPINQFDPVDGTTTKVEFLDDLSKRLAKYVANHPLGLVWTAHVNDEGRTRDSRMIAKSCSIRIDVFRDLMSEDRNERNELNLFVSKNRPYGETGYAGKVFWNTVTKTIEDEWEYDDEGGDDSLPFEASEEVVDAEFEVVDVADSKVKPF